MSAVLETGYLFGTVQGAAADEDLPFALGSITARWYTEAGRYVVIYDGLDLGAVKPLCPGNSALTANGF